MNKYIKGIIAAVAIFVLSVFCYILGTLLKSSCTDDLQSIGIIGALLSVIILPVNLIKGAKNGFERPAKKLKPIKGHIPCADFYYINKLFYQYKKDNYVINDAEYHEPVVYDCVTLLDSSTVHEQNYPISVYYLIRMSKSDGTLLLAQIERIDSGDELGKIKCRAVPIDYDVFENICGTLKPNERKQVLNTYRQTLKKED